MAIIFQSVSHRCSKCGCNVDPLKGDVEQRTVERNDGTYGLQYDHADGECMPERLARANDGTNRLVVQGHDR